MANKADWMRQRIMDDPATSYWLRNAINTLDTRDLVDAARDASIAHKYMEARCKAVGLPV